MNALPLYRAAASILLLRDSKDGLQVLMLKRPANISFANAWVFPGGCREPQDKTEFLKHCECVLSDAEACRQLGVERFGKIVAEYAEAGIDVSLDNLPVDLTEAGENLDNYRQKVGVGAFGAFSSNQVTDATPKRAPFY